MVNMNKQKREYGTSKMHYIIITILLSIEPTMKLLATIIQ